MEICALNFDQKGQIYDGSISQNEFHKMYTVSCFYQKVHNSLSMLLTNMSIRPSHTPTILPKLMAYMSHIIRVHQDYSGFTWVCYDTAFH